MVEEVIGPPDLFVSETLSAFPVCAICFIEIVHDKCDPYYLRKPSLMEIASSQMHSETSECISMLSQCILKR